METLGRYQIRGEWGRGGSGASYRGYDPDMDREVAIASMPVEGATPDQITAMAREAEALAGLRHPHVAAVHDFFLTDGQAFLVTELVGGTGLEAMLAAGGARDRKEALRILRETAAALDAAHSAGIVHRRVNPGNILLDEAGHVRIIGFGTPDTPPSGDQEAICYHSPEQLRGDPAGAASDQFALAIVACQLLTGESPFPGDTWMDQAARILDAPHTPLRDIDRKIPAAVDDALNIALQKDPLRRFPTCMAFIDSLAGAAPKKELVPAKAVLAVVMVSSVLVIFMGYRAVSALVNPAPQPAPEPAAAVAPPPPTAPPPAAPDSLSLILDGTPMDFALIPAGRFVMGCETCKDAARPEHMVELTRPFQLGRTEVTEKHWNAVTAGKSSGSNKPKVGVSWNEAQQFLARLNALNDGFTYRLPTEAEWEYAARANDPGERPRNLADLAWTAANSGGQLQETASAKLGNGWGLYDMLGNASEWTNDWFAEEYYRNSPPQDPKGPPSGAKRVVRGGNGGAGATQAGYAHRAAEEPGAKGPWLGFRVVRERK